MNFIFRTLNITSPSLLFTWECSTVKAHLNDVYRKTPPYQPLSRSHTTVREFRQLHRFDLKNLVFQIKICMLIMSYSVRSQLFSTTDLWVDISNLTNRRFSACISEITSVWTSVSMPPRDVFFDFLIVGKRKLISSGLGPETLKAQPKFAAHPGGSEEFLTFILPT